MTSYASLPAPFVRTACERYFAEIEERTIANLNLLVENASKKRKWFGLGPFYSKEDVMARVTQGHKFAFSDYLRMSVEFAQSSEYYGNDRIRNLLSLAKAAQAMMEPVYVEAEDAGLLWSED